MERLSMKRTPLKRKTPLKPIGKRGKRLLPADNATRELLRPLPCIAADYLFPCFGRKEVMHIHARGDEAIRNDPDNVLPGCRKHHTYFTRHPAAWKAFVEALFPGRWDALTRKSYGRDYDDSLAA
jgi:hypothetical protein